MSNPPLLNRHNSITKTNERKGKKHSVGGDALVKFTAAIWQPIRVFNKISIFLSLTFFSVYRTMGKQKRCGGQFGSKKRAKYKHGRSQKQKRREAAACARSRLFSHRFVHFLVCFCFFSFPEWFIGHSPALFCCTVRTRRGRGGV